MSDALGRLTLLEVMVRTHRTDADCGDALVRVVTREGVTLCEWDLEPFLEDLRTVRLAQMTCERRSDEA